MTAFVLAITNRASPLHSQYERDKSSNRNSARVLAWWVRLTAGFPRSLCSLGMTRKKWNISLANRGCKIAVLCKNRRCGNCNAHKCALPRATLGFCTGKSTCNLNCNFPFPQVFSPSPFPLKREPTATAERGTTLNARIDRAFHSLCHFACVAASQQNATHSRTNRQARCSLRSSPCDSSSVFE